MTNGPENERCDVLVLGAGIAACQAAISAAREGASVRLVGQAKGASPYILGFNVPFETGAQNALEAFEEDTFVGGYSLGHPGLIKLLGREALAAYDQLEQLGVPFASEAGRPALRHLSGSRTPRSVYVKSGTGNAIHRALVAELNRLGVICHTGLRVIQLLMQDGRVGGCLSLSRDGKVQIFESTSTVVALGGIGGLYDNSTYPKDVLGDAYALALDAGATLIDMEFVQFEPTVVLRPERVRGMEMPTAMLGDGATLLNAQGERFMLRYNPGHGEKQIEKAKMALCIQLEIDEGRGLPEGGVWFDATMLDEECLRGYETHHRRLVGSGLDPASQMVPVAPAAHSLMGGIRIDTQCGCGVPGLFACGEAAGGLHGASRIAGNGASDATALSRVAGRAAAADSAAHKPTRLELDAVSSLEPVAHPEEHARTAQRLLSSIARELATHAGIRRSAEGLNAAMNRFQEVRSQLTDTWDGTWSSPYRRVQNAVSIAQAIVASALQREESRGAHYRTDFPDTRDEWKRSITVRRDGTGELLVESSLNSEHKRTKHG